MNNRNNSGLFDIGKSIDQQFENANIVLSDPSVESTKGKSIDLVSKLLQFKIDVNEELKPPEVVWKISNQDNSDYRILGTNGNFSLLIGKAKSRKSFLVNLVVSCVVSDDLLLRRLKGGLNKDRPEVLYFDTEQSKYHVQLAVKRICRQLDITNPPNLSVYHLRGLEPKDRLQLIEFALYNSPKVGFVVIDGIKDLITSINDEEQATMMSSKLLKWTEELDIHIVTVLHQNKSDNNARGHIGTELINKAETILSVSISDKDSDVSIVEPLMCRNREPDSFAFRIDNDGIPKIEQDFDLRVEKSKPKSLQVLDIPDNQKFQLLTEIYSKGESEFLYTELTERLKVALHNQRHESIGTTKAKTLLSYIKSKGWLIQQKSKGPYTLGKYSQ